MSSNALARLGEEEGKCWAFGESCRVVPAEVAREVVVALQAERDALAAELAEMKRMTGVALMCNHVARMERAESKLAELEGQEPVAWAVMNGWAIDGIERSEKDAMAVSAERQKSHDLSGSLAAYRVSKLFARPVPAEPVNVDFGKRGENMFFKVGNQSFLLDYKPEEQDEFDFMKAMLLSAFSRITHGVKTEIMNSAISAEGKSPTSQQEHLLQDMHDAGREIDRVMAEAAPKAPQVDFEAIARAIWNVRREGEDRCDMDLEDLGTDHSVWEEASEVASILEDAGIEVAE